MSQEATERGADIKTASAMSVVKMLPLPCVCMCVCVCVYVRVRACVRACVVGVAECEHSSAKSCGDTLGAYRGVIACVKYPTGVHKREHSRELLHTQSPQRGALFFSLSLSLAFSLSL